METQQPSPKPSKQPRTWRQWIRRAVVIYVVVPYLVVTITFAVLQRRLMYRPTVVDDLSLVSLGLDSAFGIDVDLPTADGNTLRGWLVHGTDKNRSDASKNPLVLYFPGNSVNRHDRLNDLREVAKRGFDVLIFDYRGFGDSTGSPSETKLSADAQRVWQYARDDLGYSEKQIVIFGESLGGAVALSMWSETNSSLPQPAALILNSTFASMPETVAWQYPYFPFQYLVLDRWPSIQRIGRVQAPIAIFHGTNDQMVPVAHGQSLAKASSGARFIEISGGSHNDIPMSKLRQELDSILAELPASNSE